MTVTRDFTRNLKRAARCSVAMDDPQDQISKLEQQKRDGKSTQEQMLAAVEARRKNANRNNDLLTQYDDEKDLRQEFRLLIDPGMMRPSRKEVVLTSLKVRSDLHW